MIANLSIARPYAKAVFALALRDQQFLQWQDMLTALAIVATECKKNGCKLELDFFYVVSKNFPMAMNLVHLLAERKKLGALPGIAFCYKKLFFEYKKILEVKVVAVHELSAKQKERLASALQQRYQKQILLQCEVDNKLIGGAMIYVGGMVIDGSIKGALRRLKQSL